MQSNTTMKKILSLILCFAMVFGMMPAVFAAPVLENVESIEIEETAVAEAEAGLAEDTTAYATKPAQYDVEKGGILVFFENGNSADSVNLTNATYVGTRDAAPIDGYYVKDMLANEAFQLHPDHYIIGLYTGDPDSETATYTTIGYSGAAMNGSISFGAEIYNSATANKTMHSAKLTESTYNASQTGAVYTTYDGKPLAAGAWSTVVNTLSVSDGLSFIGFTRNNSHAPSYRIRSAYMYYMPTNNIKLYDGETLTSIVDLGEATTWTATAPGTGYDAWIDASGNVYEVNDTVAAGTALTAYKFSSYATKPAQYDVEKGGILVFFENGNSADSVNLTNATYVGTQDADPIDGYYVKDMLVHEVFQDHNDHYILGLYTGDPDSTTLTYTTIGYNEAAMNGSLKFYAEIYNSATTLKNMHTAVMLEGTTPNTGAVYTTYDGATVNPLTAGAWSTAVNARNISDGLSFIGFTRSNSHAPSYRIRSAYMYYMPTNNIKLYDGETLTSIVDLGEATTWTATAPGTGYNAWVDANGKYYFAGDTVAAGAALTAASVNFAEKTVADLDETMGILVYFNNGNAEDAVNLTNAELVGVSGTKATGGYYAWDMNKVETFSGLGTDHRIYGLYTGDPDAEATYTTIGYADGSAMNGKLYFRAEVYNSADAEKKINRAVVTTRSDGNIWGIGTEQVMGAVTTDWWATTLPTTTWTTAANDVSVFDELSFVGLYRQTSHATYYTIRNTYMYYMPTNNVKLYEGETLVGIEDLGTETTWTATAPTNTAYNAWVDANGRYYLAGDTVPAGTVLTAATFDVDLEDDNLGTLIWYNDFQEFWTPAYANPDWTIAPTYYNLTAPKLVTYDGRTVLDMTSYWYGGYILEASNDAPAGEYTLVVDYYAPDEKNEFENDSAWMSFNTDSKGNKIEGSVYAKPEKVGYDKWGTMSYTFTVGDGETFKNASFRGGTEPMEGITDANYYVYVDSVKLYYNEAARPITLKVSSMRKTTPQGLRIAGFVSNAVKAAADEYGFVVGKADVFTDASTLVVGAENTVSVAAYEKGGIDKWYVDASKSTDGAVTAFGEHALSENGWYFTGVYVNIPMTADALQTKLMCKTYIKIGDAYIYGEPVAKCVYEVAESLYEKYGEEAPDYAKQVYNIVNSVAAE